MTGNPITPVRLAIYSEILLLVTMLPLLLAAVFLLRGAPVYLIMVFAVCVVMTAWYFVFGKFLQRKQGKWQIGLIKNNRAIDFSNGAFVGIIFGFYWRSFLLNAVLGASLAYLASLLQSKASVLALVIDLAAQFIPAFLAFLWLFKQPYGSTRIEFNHNPLDYPIDVNGYSESSGDKYSNAAAVVESTKEAVVGTLAAFAMISYYLIGLFQMAAVYSYFRYVLDFWIIPSAILGGIIGYIPGIGAALGAYAAVNVWDWPLLAALALFFFPLVLYAIIALLVGFSEAVRMLCKRNSR